MFLIVLIMLFLQEFSTQTLSSKIGKKTKFKFLQLEGEIDEDRKTRPLTLCMPKIRPLILCKKKKRLLTLCIPKIRTYLVGANFEGAQCQGASFRSAWCQGASFGLAWCQGASFEGTQCQGAYALKEFYSQTLSSRIDRNTEFKFLQLEGEID
jgi:hypothetical protein